MNSPSSSPLFVSTPTAALLTGKSVRTIHNWLESGVIQGMEAPAAHLPGGLMRRIELSSIAEYIPTEMTKDFMESVRLADTGDAEGMNSVGLFFFESKAYPIAVTWFEAAAKKGHADAMDWLSTCYLNGMGVEKDHQRGAQWLSNAAAAGHRIAQAKLRSLGFEM